ncbi:MAG: hypothetical protein QG635_997 [Bacteroidota bacterium]|nr:hypothetical protein [Bacteroidota bacterium]
MIENTENPEGMALLLLIGTRCLTSKITHPLIPSREGNCRTQSLRKKCIGEIFLPVIRQIAL